MRAVAKLAHSDKLEPTTAYRVGRLFTTAAKEMEKARSLEDEMKKKFLKMDDKGELLKNESGQNDWVDPDKSPTEFEAEFEKMMESKSVDIKVHKLEFQHLKDLTPMELMALDPIVTGQPAE